VTTTAVNQGRSEKSAVNRRPSVNRLTNGADASTEESEPLGGDALLRGGYIESVLDLTWLDSAT
jgi:hypothetical protein